MWCKGRVLVCIDVTLFHSECYVTFSLCFIRQLAEFKALLFCFMIHGLDMHSFFSKIRLKEKPQRRFKVCNDLSSKRRLSCYPPTKRKRRSIRFWKLIRLVQTWNVNNAMNSTRTRSRCVQTVFDLFNRFFTQPTILLYFFNFRLTDIFACMFCMDHSFVSGQQALEFFLFVPFHVLLYFSNH